MRISDWSSDVCSSDLNPDLDPEKSTAFTAGVIFEPIRNVSLTVDFWHIKVKDLIVGVTDTSAAEEAYYANNGVVNIPGITVIPGQPDPAFPNALPVLGFKIGRASCRERVCKTV